MPVRTLIASLISCVFLLLPACGQSREARTESALLADNPPADFWLGVTVLRPVPLGAIINARTEPPNSTIPRPARYIVEADAILRVAIGYGATEKTFPPETRQLTPQQLADIWQLLRDSALVDPDHPDRTGRIPELEEFSRTTQGRGGYSVSFCIAGDRRILAIDEASPAAADARRLVDQLAALAWIKPRVATDAAAPTPETTP